MKETTSVYAAVKPLCSGDGCTGKDPVKMNCDSGGYAVASGLINHVNGGTNKLTKTVGIVQVM